MRKRGFTLVEIMVVIVIIGLLITLAMPAFLRIRNNTAATTLANDLKVFRAALETYALDQGAYPPDSSPGTDIPGLRDYLPQGFFLRTTPIGGSWDIDIDGSAGFAAAVGVGGASDVDQKIILQADKILDDGDPETGDFRWVNADGGRPYLIVEE